MEIHTYPPYIASENKPRKYDLTELGSKNHEKISDEDEKVEGIFIVGKRIAAAVLGMRARICIFLLFLVFVFQNLFFFSFWTEDKQLLRMDMSGDGHGGAVDFLICYVFLALVVLPAATYCSVWSHDIRSSTLASLASTTAATTATTPRHDRLPCVPPPGNKPCLLDLEFCVYIWPGSSKHPPHAHRKK